MVKTLHVPYEKVLKLESKLNIRLSFEEITLLTLVISFNKTDIGYCATNEQLADFLRCSKRKAQAVKKSLIKNKLVTEIRRGNNSTILKPVKKAVSILCYPVSKNSSTQVAQNARNTLSKDREYNTQSLTSLLETCDNDAKQVFTARIGKFTDEQIMKDIQTYLKKKDA